MELRIDPERRAEWERTERCTGIFVRARDEAGKWHSVDIAHLTKDSLFEWLRSRGGENPWAENTVAVLLGYDISGGPANVR